MTSERELDGYVAVVTGGNGGIGFGIAGELARAGARIAIWGRNADKSALALERLTAVASDAQAFSCDVSSAESVTAATADTIRRFGKIDIMVANAGLSVTASLAETTLEQWRSVIDTDLTGVFLCFRAAINDLISRRAPGSLIAVASVAAFHSQPTKASYSAAKAGIIGLVRSAAAEVAEHGIRCNALTPGWTDSDKVSLETASDSLRLETTSSIPVGRWATAAELGRVARFLANPELIVHTGANVVVDGGYSTMPGYLAVRRARVSRASDSPSGY